MTDIARLAIEVDPKQLQAAVQQLEKLSVASGKAQVEAKKLEKAEASAALAIATANRQAANAAVQAAAATTKVGSAQRIAAAEGRKQAEAAYQAAKGIDLQAAASLRGAQAALQASDAAQKLVQSNQSVAGSAQTAAAAQDRTMRNMGRLAGQQQANMSNIAAQFQDIGVTAAMGMNPMMIGLQQGAQLTGVWGSVAGTTAQKLKTFGASIMAVLSPMSLVIIALTAGIAYLIQWGMEAFNAGKEVKSLETAMGSLSSMQSALGEMFDTVSGKIENNTELIRLNTLQTILNAQAKATQLAAESKGVLGTIGAFGKGGTPGSGFGFLTTGDEIEQRKVNILSLKGLALAYDQTAVSAEKAAKMVAGLDLRGTGFTKEELQSAFIAGGMAKEIGDLADKAMQSLESGTLDPALRTKGTTRTPREKKPEATQSEKFAEMMKESDLMIWQLNQEADAAGRSGLAAKEYAYAIQLESDARKQGIDLSKEDRQARLDLKAVEMAAAAQKKENIEAYYREINGIQEQTLNLKTQIATLGMSESAIMTQMFARKLLNDEIFRGISYSPADKAALKDAYALNVQLTEQYNRQKQTLDEAKGAVRGFVGDMKSGLLQGKSVWESWGNAVMNVLDRVIDKILTDLVNAMFEVNGGGGILGGLTKLFGAVGALGGMPSIGTINSQALDTMRSTYTPATFANGGAFTNGVVHKPTAFFAKGGTPGVMGEAGPEAIMPLQRGPDGSLGVQMYGGAGVSEPTVVQVIPSEYFDVVVDQRAARVSAPMVVQGAIAANKVSENTSARRSRRRLS